MEVYVDGKWHFLGACEPEEILDKGWFSSASSRALRVHSRSFSDFMSERKEGCLGKQELLYYYNHTDTYARTKNLQVNVLDGEKRPVAVHLRDRIRMRAVDRVRNTLSCLCNLLCSRN